MKKILRVAAALLMILTVLPWGRALAEGAQPCDDTASTQYFAAANGQVAHLVITCAFGGSDKDKVIVFDRNGDMKASSRWRDSADFTEDLWVFDAGGDGQFNLAIDFHTDGKSLIADLYDDQDGDGKVAVDTEKSVPAVTESKYPTVRVTASDGWWAKGGITNFNLDLSVDGPVYAAYASELYLDRLKTDGRPDFVSKVRDSDRDGRPDYQWINASPDVPDSWGIYRTELMVNTKGDEHPITNFLFWPYLGTSFKPPRGFQGGQLPTVAFVGSGDVSYGFVKDYGQSFPPIQIWWPASKLAYVGEFVASRGNESNWFVYSISRFASDSKQYANFENPFAFYDLANDRDGYPELQIRVEYNGAKDPFFQDGTFVSPVEMVRYSWDQYNTRKWDFKLNLIGRHAIDSTVEFPDFTVATIPYDDLPGWVTNNKWDSAEFVAVEKPSYWTSEGIYESLATTLGARNTYVTGLTAMTPQPDFADWPTGLRSEYNLDLQDRPQLYFSPVDRKLHLLNAHAGLWKLNSTRRIEYANLGGPYLNHWALVENDNVTAQLYLADSYVIYSGGNTVQFARADVAPTLFEATPPRTHLEWSALGTELNMHTPTFAPDDFSAMFEQFGEPRFMLAESSLHNFRLKSDGFRFVLELRPGFKAEGSDGPEVAGLQPGSYLVTYDGQFTVAPLTSAQPQVVPGSLRLSDPSPVELQPIQIGAFLENKGLEDLANLRVQALVNGPGLSSAQIITETEITLLGGQTVPVRFDWTPPAPGEWQIHLAWYVDDPQHTVLSTWDDVALTVDVAHRPALEPQTTWEISNTGQPIPLLLLLAGLGLGAAVLMTVIVRGTGKQG